VVVAPSSARCDRLGRGTRATSNIKMSIQTGGNEIVEELILIQDYGYICVRAPLQLSHRGVGGVGLRGCWQRGGPESFRKFLRRRGSKVVADALIVMT
jgi:hypothetical protein